MDRAGDLHSLLDAQVTTIQVLMGEICTLESAAYNNIHQLVDHAEHVYRATYCGVWSDQQEMVQLLWYLKNDPCVTTMYLR